MKGRVTGIQLKMYYYYPCFFAKINGQDLAVEIMGVLFRIQYLGTVISSLTGQVCPRTGKTVDRNLILSTLTSLGEVMFISNV